MKFVIAVVVLVVAIGASYIAATPVEKSGEESISVIPTGNEPARELTVEIYDDVSVNTRTKDVDLSERGLAGSLKAEVRQLEELKTLNLSNNKFTGLPAEVGQLSFLETLDLSNNNFTGLPHELGNLQNLKVLDLRGNNISQFDLELIRERLPATTQVFTD